MKNHNESARSKTAVTAAPSLPFAWEVTQKKFPWLENCDYPMRQTVINGEVWIMHVPNSHVYKAQCQVNRFKGPDLEHLERQPDGFGDFTGAAAFLGCGLWWDEETRTVYGLMHSEYDHNKKQGWCSKKTRLATSKDLGLTWTLVGDILTRALPNVADYSGSCFEAGPADFDFYADTRGGYFYLTSWNSFTPKTGKLNGFTMYSEVARCAIADKMAPGKWFKFSNGTWTEPGLGGKASRVGFDRRGIYGNTLYSSYLNKYVRIGVHCGCKDDRGMPGYGFEDRSINISACTDLAKQDWSPMAKLLDEPRNATFGFTLSDSKGIDPVACGQTLRIFNYWQNAEGKNRILDITFKKGSTPSRYFPPHDSYTYEPHPESGDPIESRKTQIIGPTDPATRYDGDGWTDEKDEHYYKGQAKTASKAGQTVQFKFQGRDIYWRAAAGPDSGKADVFIDDVLQETVDCFFAECPLVYQFTFIKTGLDPKRTHTIKVVVRGDKNPASSGTKIRHIAFEVAIPLSLSVNPLHGYTNRPVKLEAVLADENTLGPGEYPVSLCVSGSTGIVWKQDITLRIPKPVAGSKPGFSVPVFSKEVVLDGSPGEYMFIANMEADEAPVGGPLKFYRSDPVKPAATKTKGTVTLWGIEKRVEDWLVSCGIASRQFKESSPKTREVILVGNQPVVDNDPAGWKELIRQMACGSTVIFLSPSSGPRSTTGKVERKGTFNPVLRDSFEVSNTPKEEWRYFNSELWGQMGYVISDLPDRDYTVELGMCEGAYTKEGERIFDVTINGSTVLQEFDIVKEAGGWHRAIVRRFKIRPRDSKIEVNFISRKDNPAMSRLRIYNDKEQVIFEDCESRYPENFSFGLPLAKKGRRYEFVDWLYHQECVTKPHPVFEGLSSKGIMDPDYYGQVIPHYILDGQEAPEKVIAAAPAVGYSCRDGFASGEFVLIGSYPFGVGRFILNTLRILENVGIHPVADRLLLNMIDYVRSNAGKPLEALPADFASRLKAIGYELE